ncbi:alpha/beta fold hydrolase [Roseomonas sp. BN140053]|uniref:alpha/beta fold hydrolase n=1 Tax=Roseomonas sp. BN140053 TaxID=3391898 RepID=UPI0039EC3985
MTEQTGHAGSGSPKPAMVLVHGAWHGAWCWDRVAGLLRDRGFPVVAPTLTGLAERAHLLSPAVNLSTHVADVVEAVRDAVSDGTAAGGVVLVGHSYGGMVVSQAVEALEELTRAIVFLDAFVPEDGQAQIGYAPEPLRLKVEEAIRTGTGVPAFPAAHFGVNERDRDWVDASCTPHPPGTLTEPVRLTGARDRVPARAYILAGNYPNPRFHAYHDACAAKPGWQCFRIASGHDVMLDAPEELAALLAGFA